MSWSALIHNLHGKVSLLPKRSIGWMFFLGLSMATLSFLFRLDFIKLFLDKAANKNNDDDDDDDDENSSNREMTVPKQESASNSSSARSPEFEQACAKVRASSSLSTGDQLFFYGLYKQATVGDAPQSSAFLESFTEQAKRHSWAQFRGMSHEMAAQTYIQRSQDIANWTQSSSRGNTLFMSPPPVMKLKEEDDEEDNPLVIMTPGEQFLAAARLDQVDRLGQLLETGMDVNCTDEGGQTALHFAADVGALQSLQFLLQHGANPRAADQYGISVLQVAVIAGQVEACQILLRQGADPDQTDHDGDSPRSCAADDGNPDLQRLFQIYDDNKKEHE